MKTKQIEDSIKILACLAIGSAFGLMFYLGYILQYGN